MGYTNAEMKNVPEGANLGLGCGNPVAIASLKPGETVLDLGSGGGFDCFLAANKVGKEGHVIGVDMTNEMIEKARQNAEKGKYKNVEFRLGEIEHLPVADNSVDVIISNCVINLSADKGQVIRDAYRVLKPGGRVMISDLTLLKELPHIQKSVEAYTSCIGGAILLDEYKKLFKEAGFKNTKFTKNELHYFEEDAADYFKNSTLEASEDTQSLTEYVVSVYIEAHKICNIAETEQLY